MKTNNWLGCGQGTLLHPVTRRQVTTEVVELEGFGRIFEVYHYGDDPQKTQTLIEAAPELLAALENCCRIIERDDLVNGGVTPALQDARAAIAKAKGLM